MEFKLNFSFLSAIKLQREKITHREITDVFYGDKNQTAWDSLPQYSQFDIYYYIIGFSFQKRFLQVVLSSDGDEIYFMDVKVADLEEITHDFFKK